MTEYGPILIESRTKEASLRVYKMDDDGTVRLSFDDGFGSGGINVNHPDTRRALAAAIDPSHAALVAQVERLRKAVRQADMDQQWQTHAWFGSGEFVYSGSDDDIETNSEHLQPGDLGEGGA